MEREDDYPRRDDDEAQDWANLQRDRFWGRGRVPYAPPRTHKKTREPEKVPDKEKKEGQTSE